MIEFLLWTIFCISLGILVGYFMKKEERVLLGYFHDDKDNYRWYQSFSPSTPAPLEDGSWSWPIALYTDYRTKEKNKTNGGSFSDSTI